GGETAIYNSSGLAYYRHSDHLGSSRFASTPTRTMYASTAYSPFGETYAQTTNKDVSFTGQEQDTVPGDYDFVSSNYDTKPPRWTSPDPAGLASVDPTNPQSWNRYAYEMNYPLNAVDPLGLVCVWDDGSFDAADDPLTGTSDGCHFAGGTWLNSDMEGAWSDQANADLANLVDWMNS